MRSLSRRDSQSVSGNAGPSNARRRALTFARRIPATINEFIRRRTVAFAGAALLRRLRRARAGDAVIVRKLVRFVRDLPEQLLARKKAA